MSRRHIAVGLAVMLVLVSAGSVAWLNRTSEPCEIREVSPPPELVLERAVGADRSGGVFESESGSLVAHVVGGASNSEREQIRRGMDPCDVQVKSARFSLQQLDEFLDRLDDVLVERRLAGVGIRYAPERNRIVVEYAQPLSAADLAAFHAAVPDGAVEFAESEFGPVREL